MSEDIKTEKPVAVPVKVVTWDTEDVECQPMPQWCLWLARLHYRLREKNALTILVLLLYSSFCVLALTLLPIIPQSITQDSSTFDIFCYNLWHGTTTLKIILCAGSLFGSAFSIARLLPPERRQ